MKNIFLFKQFYVLKESGQAEMIVVILYCLRMFTSAWLAFNYPTYPIFFLFMDIAGKLAIITAVLYLIFVQKRITLSNLILCSLPLIFVVVMLLSGTNAYTIYDKAMTIFAIIVFILLNNRVKRNILVLFYILVLMSIIVSVILYVLVLLHLWKQIAPYYGDNGMKYYYKLGPFAVLNSNGLFRMCGPFNEGGNLGTICAFLYAIFDKKNTKGEKIVLLMAIAMSFSLAGWILLFMYWVFDLISQKKIKGAMLSLIVIGAFLVIPHIDWGNEYVNLFAQRFSVTSDGLSGDNRTWYAFDNQYNQVINSTRKWLGYGMDYDIVPNSSFKRYIIYFGYIGTTILCAPWIIAAIKNAKKNSRCIILILIFMISLYQRPTWITSLFGYIIMFGGMEIIKTTDNKQFEHGNAIQRMVVL